MSLITKLTVRYVMKEMFIFILVAFTVALGLYCGGAGKKKK